MAITEPQAFEWAGSATADDLTRLPSHPTGRVTVEVCRQMTQFSTAVVYRLVPGGPDPPILPPPETSAVRISIWASEVLRRNEGKRVTIEGVQQKKSGLAHRDKAGDEPFLKTFGYESDITQRNPGIPYLRLMFDPVVSDMMHAYIKQAVSWMMHGGTGQNNFRPLLWVGLRDWGTSSAWTRSVVLLAAKRYRKRVTEAQARHQQAQEQLLYGHMTNLGLPDDHQLQSLSHLPSLTVRQARRSRVSERELRARWA